MTSNLKTRADTGMGELLAIFAALGLVIFFWSSPYIFPFKIIVVFFHELSHGIAAIVTGGEIVRIEVSYQVGGVCWTSGGSRLLTLSAGYLGSLLFGAGILLASAKSEHDSIIIGLFGALLTGVAIIYVRPFIGFGFLFCVVMGAALMAGALFIPTIVNDFILKVVGLTSMLYAPLDIFDDVLKRSHLRSDATMLAELTYIPSTVWGVIWILISIIIIGLVVRELLREKE